QHTIARYDRDARQIAPVDLRQIGILNGVSGEEELFELPLPHHHHFAGARSSAALFSITRPAANRVSSSNGRPISCSPSGSPEASLPAGTAMPGSPAMLTVTVNTSLRYIFTGSTLRSCSPMPNAADGVAGVRIASTPP